MTNRQVVKRVMRRLGADPLVVTTALVERVYHLEQQLAAERALCDRLARYARDPLRRGPSHILRDYDAHRATERSEAEGP